MIRLRIYDGKTRGRGGFPSGGRDWDEANLLFHRPRRPVAQSPVTPSPSRKYAIHTEE
jgi:hypothetical protein